MSQGEENHGDQLDDLYASRAATQEIEVILARQLSGYLAIPTVIIDPSHVIIYYNEPMERIVGRRFDEGGAVPFAELSEALDFTDEAGKRIPPMEMPLATAMRSRKIARRRLRLRGFDGVKRHMEEVAIPLIGNAGRFLGAIAFFEEVEA